MIHVEIAVLRVQALSDSSIVTLCLCSVLRVGRDSPNTLSRSVVETGARGVLLVSLDVTFPWPPVVGEVLCRVFSYSDFLGRICVITLRVFRGCGEG